MGTMRSSPDGLGSFRRVLWCLERSPSSAIDRSIWLGIEHHRAERRLALSAQQKSPSVIFPIPSFTKMMQPSLEKQGKHSFLNHCKADYVTLVCLFLGNMSPYSLDLGDSCISKEFLNVKPRFKCGTLEALEVKEMMLYVLRILNLLVSLNNQIKLGLAYS